MVKKKLSPKKITFKQAYSDYLHGKVNLKLYQKIGITMLIFVIAGFVGWVYEFIFGFFDHGCTEWYMQGGNFLPWINIYAFGALLVVPLTYKFRRYPALVFLISFLVTGIVELIGGWLVYTIGNGTRYWDYNNKPWNLGNIGGFVCLLSVTFFAIGSILLMYVVLPFCQFLSKRLSKRAFLTLAISLFTLIILDELGNLILKNTDHPTAVDFYRSLGWEYDC